MIYKICKYLCHDHDIALRENRYEGIKYETESYKKVIPLNEMQDIIVDLHLTDATFANYVNNNKPVFVKKSFYDSLFAKHKITKRQFLWNVIHYSQDKKILLVYEKAISQLTMKKAEYERNILKEKAQKK